MPLDNPFTKAFRYTEGMYFARLEQKIARANRFAFTITMQITLLSYFLSQ